MRNQLHPQVDSDIRAARQRNDRLRSVHQFLLEVAVESQSPDELEDLLVEIDSAAALIRNMATTIEASGDRPKANRRSWVVDDAGASASEGFIEALRAAEQATKERYDNPDPALDPEWAEPKSVESVVLDSGSDPDSVVLDSGSGSGADPDPVESELA